MARDIERDGAVGSDEMVIDQETAAAPVVWNEPVEWRRGRPSPSSGFLHLLVGKRAAACG